MFIRLRSVIALCILGAVAALAAGFVANGLGGSVFWAQTVSGPPWGAPVIGNKVSLSSPGTSDNFGISVAVSADESTIVVGAPADNSNAGAIYVFSRPSGGWGGGTTPTSVKMTGSGAGAMVRGFGSSVAVSRDGGTIVVGAPNTAFVSSNAGAAYVFTKPATGWATTVTGAQFRMTSVNLNDYVGASVAVSEDGNTVAIGSPERDAGINPNRGRVDVIARPSGGWVSGTNSSLNAQRLPGGGTNNEKVGFSVSVSANGDTVVVGTDPTSGTETVYVYPRPSSGWTRLGTQSTPALLTKESAALTDQFGKSVTMSGDGNTIVVGASGAGVGGTAYVFAKPTAGWSTTTTAARLTASDGASGYNFGESVSVNTDGSVIAIGEPDRGGTAADRGAVHLFARPAGGKWTDATTASSLSGPLPDETTRGERGSERALSVGGNVVVVGAYGTGRTGAWVYNTSAAPAPTATPTPTATPIHTATPTVTPTPIHTATPTVTPTSIHTATSILTETPIGGGEGEGGEGVDVTPTVTSTPRPTSTPEPPRPEVGLSTNFLTFTAARGGDAPPSQTFTVWNTERQTEMPFTLSSDASWLSFSPRSASSNSPQARVTVRVSANASGLAAGTYRGRIAISAPAAENTPRTVFVTLNVNGPTAAMTPTPTPEPLVLTTPDSTVQLVVPALPPTVRIGLAKLDADAPGAPPADQERVVLAAELDTYASGSNTPTPMTYSPGVDLRFALPAADAAACAEGRVRVYRVSGDEWTLLQHRCETDASGAVWAVTTLTNFSTYVMVIDDAPATPTPTAVPTATPVPTATSVPTAVPTATPIPATATPVPTATSVPTAIPTATPRPATATPRPTATSVPTAIPTATPRPATATPRPTATFAPTAIPTATSVPATATPMPAATFTPVPPATAVTQAVATSTPVPAAPEAEDGGPNMGLIIAVVVLVVIAGAAAAVLYVRRGGMGAG